MSRHLALLASCLIAAALVWSGCSSTGGAPDGAPTITAYSVDTALLKRELGRVDRTYDMAVARLRTDSGTARADIVFLEAHRAIEDSVAAVVEAVNDTALQLHLWHDGAVGQRLARTGSYGTTLEGVNLDDSETELRELFKRNGVHVVRAEGDSYFQLDLLRLAAAVHPYVTDATRDYLRLAANEQHAPFTDHEVILIPWDSLAARLQHVDGLITRHVSTAVTRRLAEWRDRYLDGYLTGFANTPVFDQAGILREEVRRSFARFAADSPRSHSGRIVAEYLEMLEKGAFRKTPAMEQFRWRTVVH